MATKTSAPHLSCAKVVVLFALLVYLAVNEVTADSISKEDTRCSDTVNSLTVIHKNVSVKRHLKANVDMPMNGRAADPPEERAALLGIREFGTKVKSSLSGVIEAIRVRWLWLIGRKPEDMLRSLKYRYNLKGEQLVESRAYFRWVAFVNYVSKSPEEEMFSTLARIYDGDELIDILVFTAKKYDAKLLELLDAKRSGYEAFMELQPYGYPKKLSENPVFFRWLAFLAAKDRNLLESEMIWTVSRLKSGDELVDALAFAAHYDLELQKLIADPTMSSHHVFKHLKLDEVLKNKDAKLFEEKGFFKWFAYLSATKKENVQAEMIATLEKFCSSTGKDLDDLLAEGSYAVGAQSISVKMLHSRISKWPNKNKKDRIKIFRMLKLDKEIGRPLFDRPQLKLFADYIKHANDLLPKKNMKHPSDFNRNIFSTVKEVYEINGLSKLIDESKSDPYGLAAKMRIMLSKYEKPSRASAVMKFLKLSNQNKSGGR